jgi:hypothetical protein
MPKIAIPDEEEDRRLTDAALDDPDNPPLTDHDFARMRWHADGRLASPLAYARLMLEPLAEDLANVRPEQRARVSAVLNHVRKALAAIDAEQAHAAE